MVNDTNHWLGAYRTYAFIVDTSLSVLMTLRMCLCELYCLFGIFYCLDLNLLLRAFYLFMFS